MFWVRRATPIMASSTMSSNNSKECIILSSDDESVPKAVKNEDNDSAKTETNGQNCRIQNLPKDVLPQPVFNNKDYERSPLLNKMTEDAFIALDNFSAACRQFLKTKQDDMILEKVRTLAAQSNLHYLASDKFLNKVKFLTEQVQRDQKNVYVHIKSLTDELKMYKEKKPKAKAKTSTCSSDVTSSHDEDSKSARIVPPVNNEQNCVNNGSLAKEPEVMTSAMPVVLDEKELKKRRMIRKLEKLLAKLEQKIQTLSEKEVNFDSDEDDYSPYIMESRLKAHAVKVWKKIRELEGTDDDTRREIYRKFHYEGTQYPEINKKVEKLINKKKIFPDFTDIHSIVSHVNESSSLSMTSHLVHQTAVEIFNNIGKQLKQRRQHDDIETMQHLFEKAEADPAENDPELAEKLKTNRTEGMKKLDEIIDKYAIQQTEMKLEPQDVEEENCNQSPPPSPKTGDEEEDEDDDEEEDDGIEDIKIADADASTEDEESSAARTHESASDDTPAEEEEEKESKKKNLQFSLENGTKEKDVTNSNPSEPPDDVSQAEPSTNKSVKVCKADSTQDIITITSSEDEESSAPPAKRLCT